MKLNIAAFALAFGIWWGGGVFLTTWWLIIVGASPDELPMLSTLYSGYTVSPVGSLVGLIWGVVCGAILAWLYNLFSNCLGRSSGEAA